MPISSLILRTATDQTTEVVLQVNQIDHASVSEVATDNIVVITETQNQKQDKDLWDQLEKIPGVIQCDLIYHNFEDMEEGLTS